MEEDDIYVVHPPDTGWKCNSDETAARCLGICYPALHEKLSHRDDLRVTKQFENKFLTLMNSKRLPVYVEHESKQHVGYVNSVEVDEKNNSFICDFEIGGNGIDPKKSRKIVQNMLNLTLNSLSVALSTGKGEPFYIKEISVCEDGMLAGTNILFLNTFKDANLNGTFMSKKGMDEYEHGMKVSDVLEKAKREFVRDFLVRNSHTRFSHQDLMRRIKESAHTKEMLKLVTKSSTRNSSHIETKKMAETLAPPATGLASPVPPPSVQDGADAAVDGTAVVSEETSMDPLAKYSLEEQEKIREYQTNPEALYELLQQCQRMEDERRVVIANSMNEMYQVMQASIIALDKPELLNQDGTLNYNSIRNLPGMKKKQSGNDKEEEEEEEEGDKTKNKTSNEDVDVHLKNILSEDGYKMAENFKALMGSLVGNSAKNAAPSNQSVEVMKTLEQAKSVFFPLAKQVIHAATHPSVTQNSTNAFHAPPAPAPVPPSSSQHVQKPGQMISKKRPANDDDLREKTSKQKETSKHIREVSKGNITEWVNQTVFSKWDKPISGSFTSNNSTLPPPSSSEPEKDPFAGVLNPLTLARKRYGK